MSWGEGARATRVLPLCSGRSWGKGAWWHGTEASTGAGACIEGHVHLVTARCIVSTPPHVPALRRWERAHKFGLNPPEEVRDLIMAAGGDGSSADKNLWHDRI